MPPFTCELIDLRALVAVASIPSATVRFLPKVLERFALEYRNARCGARDPASRQAGHFTRLQLNAIDWTTAGPGGTAMAGDHGRGLVRRAQIAF